MNFKTFDIFEDVPEPTIADKMYNSLIPDSMLPTNFVGLVVGKPGAGKTFLISKLLENRNAYFKKFDILLVVSPHAIESIPYDPQYWSKTFSIDWIKERLTYFKQLKDLQHNQDKGPKKKLKLEDMVSTGDESMTPNNGFDEDMEDEDEDIPDDEIDDNDMDEESDDFGGRFKKTKKVSKQGSKLQRKTNKNTPHSNNNGGYKALIILDDVIADIKKAEQSSELQRMFFNRRHIVDGVVANFVITAQNYRRFPNMFRSVLTYIIFFNIPPKDLKIVAEEQIYSSNSGIKNVIQQHFKQSPHNFVYIRLDKYAIFLNFENLCS
jgi:hypothetical protein